MSQEGNRKQAESPPSRRDDTMEIKFNKIIWSFRYAVHSEYAIPRIFAVSVSLPSNGWLILDRCHTGAYNLWDCFSSSLSHSVAYEQNLFLLSAFLPFSPFPNSVWAPLSSVAYIFIFFLWPKTITKWKIYLSSWEKKKWLSEIHEREHKKSELIAPLMFPNASKHQIKSLKYTKTEEKKSVIIIYYKMNAIKSHRGNTLLLLLFSLPRGCCYVCVCVHEKYSMKNYTINMSAHIQP